MSRFATDPEPVRVVIQDGQAIEIKPWENPGPPNPAWHDPESPASATKGPEGPEDQS